MIKFLQKFSAHFNLSSFILIIFLILPILLITLYEYFLASDRYESTGSVYITEEQTQSNPFDLSLLGISGSSSTRDILVLKSFIESLSMLEKLDEVLEIREHFASPDADFLSRLSADTEKEYALQYYNKHIMAKLDEDAKLLKLSVQTFDAEYSKKVLDQILVYSQKFIDRLNKNITNSQFVFFESAVKRSEEELLIENRRLQNFQKENKIFSTELATQSLMGTISGLEQQLAIKQAELASRQGALGENAPTLIRLKAEIGALQDQVSLENERLSGTSGKSLSDLDADFREIKLRIEYRTLRYKANLEAFEKAQLDTARRLRFLTVVSAPTLPEASLYPNRLYIVVTGAIISLMIYILVSISVAIMREHA